jgi:apolipoprotein N-acyltransferase
MARFVPWLWAIGSGLIWALAFPHWNIAGFGWIAPAGILLAAAGQPRRRAFLLGYVAGLVHALTALYWLLYIPFPGGAIAGWLSLSAYVALFPAAWVLFCWTLLPRRIFGTAGNGFSHMFEQLRALNFFERAGWSLLCAAGWVALEMIRGRFLSGFPWNFLGVSQYRLTPLIQIASIAGVYGIAFLMVWFSTALLFTFARLIREPGRHRAFMAELLLPGAVVVGVMFWGANRVREDNPETRGTVRLALVQPSIPQRLIWDPSESKNRFQKLMDLSEKALAEGADVLVWPEAALPSFSEENFQAITNLVARHGVSMVFGADNAEVSATATNYFNAAFLFGPNGRYASHYYKRRLVIFGEYVPLSNVLPFLKFLTPIDGGFTAGEKLGVFDFGGKARGAPLICFEDVFPQEAWEHATDDVDFLLNLTNDGWFGESAAQWQQAASALLRAVENHRVVVRCTNNGLTCWIDPVGRFRKIFGEDAGNVYAPGFAVVTIPLAPQEILKQRTFYNRHGDLFGWIMCGISGVALVSRKRWNRFRVNPNQG